ncbi:TlpA disulfide reductase family protein [Motiliproteus sp. SC1-56]|uniref:TlpA disulfide reductase family protein n=1 Tax=Motiliproteus sp. SC1-56 TaxID=2799565 RepID=UPI001A8FCA5D|nr:TlpA disulfide reductase family protein [Motiliproteus sp. SC1-56]
MPPTLRAPLVLLLLLISPALWANHAATEPSDGTVNSFIPVDPPRELVPLAMMENRDQPRSLSDFKGKVVLLNLWATWCPPCIRELPALDRLQARHGDEDFVVLAVALDRAGYDAVKAYYDKLELQHLGLYHASISEFSQAFPVDVFPASFMIDREGRVTSFMRSYADWDDMAADEFIKRLKAR